MAAAGILRYQDCLRQAHRVITTDNHPRNTNFCNNTSRSRRRKRSPSGFESARRNEPTIRNTDWVAPNFVAKNLVMGQVKILKRGEPFPEENRKPVTSTGLKKVGSGASNDANDELFLCSTGRIGPDPKTVQKQIRTSDFYAGSNPTVASPPPSSLPFPTLFAKKEKNNDPATSNLLRLLGLDLP